VKIFFTGKYLGLSPTESLLDMYPDYIITSDALMKEKKESGEASKEGISAGK